MFKTRRKKMKTNTLDYARFYSAAGKGENSLLKFMLSNGFNVHESNDLAIRCAAEYGQLETVKLLWEHGAYIHILNNSPLRWASYYGETEVVKFLLTHGANVHAYNDEALCNAIRRNHIDTVKCILSYYTKPLSVDSCAYALAKQIACEEIFELVKQKAV